MSTKKRYFYSSDDKNIHNECLPRTFRMLIVGPSGCGKTALLMKLLLKDGLLNYDKLYICARSLYQPEYRILQCGLEKKLKKKWIRMLMNGDQIFKNTVTLEEVDEDDSISIEDIAELLSEDPNNTTDVEFEAVTKQENVPDPTELDRKEGIS